MAPQYLTKQKSFVLGKMPIPEVSQHRTSCRRVSGLPWWCCCPSIWPIWRKSHFPYTWIIRLHCSGGILIISTSHPQWFLRQRWCRRYVTISHNQAHRFLVQLMLWSWSLLLGTYRRYCSGQKAFFAVQNGSIQILRLFVEIPVFLTVVGGILRLDIGWYETLLYWNWRNFCLLTARQRW